MNLLSKITGRRRKRTLLLLFLGVFLLAIQLVAQLKFPVLDSIPKQTSITHGECVPTSKEMPTLSACLLVNDDNFRLPEWIAYHYYAMNLRHLVITPDPRSREWPDQVLERWRPYMTIETWHDRDWMEPAFFQGIQNMFNDKNPKVAIQAHRMRQPKFYQTCSEHLQQQNKTWTSYWDVDEFVVPNYKLVPNASQHLQRPGGIMEFLANLQSAIQHLEEFTNHTLDRAHHKGPCIAMYRTEFTAKESTLEETSKGVPSWLDPRRFDTLRWRYRGKVVIGKVMMDLSRVDLTQKSVEKFNSPHNVHKGYCASLRPDIPPFPHEDAYAHLHHYIGTWETFMLRKNDMRRQGDPANAKKEWRQKSNPASSVGNDDIRPWIRGFVDQMGEDTAKKLLEGNGVIPDATIVH